MSRAPLLALSLAATALVAASARADAPDAQARAGVSFRQAQAAFQRGEFAAAAAAFEQAAEYAPHPAPLLDAEDAWERAGDPVRAIRDCDRVLAMPDAAATYRGPAEACVARLAPSVATIELRGSRTLSLRVDAGDEVAPPIRQRLAPGHHTLTVSDVAAARTRTEPLDVAAGESRAIDVAPFDAPSPPRALAAPAPEAPAPAPRVASRGPSAASFALFGAAAVGLVVGGVFALETASAKSDFDAAPTPATRDAFYRSRTVCDVGFVVFGAAGLGGLALWLFRPTPDAPRVTASASQVALTLPF